MFEQASIDTQGAFRNPWAFTFSVVGQTLAITAGVLISLIHTEALPRLRSYTTLAPPGVSTDPGPITSPPAQDRTSRIASHVYSAPPRIPSSVSLEPHGQSFAPPENISGGDFPVIGATGPGTGTGAFLFDVLSRLPAPPVRIEQASPRKPATAAPNKPIPVSTGVQAAKLIAQVKPIYPPMAVATRISGTVRLAAIIGREGAIQNLQVVSGHPFLVQAALDAVKQWRYQPTLLNGEPVEVITQIDVNFTLSK